ncbi:lysozyme inhibitor LprI family protein [Butyrivibrio sp. AD3002]|uniref:lysozyme inhibitor LprI family protein n=1 Tax=Butyrivibrio sp. AD3002 TaxID=1280670 RepID=UPI0003B4DC9A|nr:lysozyme inhibitor LprI family protein [Butyrivibrio sp. AD3002]
MRRFTKLFVILGISTLIAGCTPTAQDGSVTISEGGETASTADDQNDSANNEQDGDSDSVANTDNADISENTESSDDSINDGAEENNNSDNSSDDKNSENLQRDDTTEDNIKSQNAESDLYDAFLVGDSTLSFDYYMNNVFQDSEYRSYVDDIISYVPTDREYTLSELRNTLQGILNNDAYYFAGGDIETMEYAFIDCGADDVREMALKMVGPFVEPGSELTLVIKELEGKLQVIYAFASWSRSQTDIYEYGIISGGGSNGASNHGWDEAYINADGKYQFGYYEEQEMDFEMFANYKDHANFDLSDIEGSMTIYNLQLEEWSKDKKIEQYYSFEVYDNETYETMNIPNLYTDSKYKDVVDSFKDCKFVSMDELYKIEADKMESIGVTDKIKNGKMPTYSNINLYMIDDNTSGENDNKKAETDTKSSETIVDDGTLQSELAKVEAKYQEYENLDWASMPQQPANVTTYEMYTLWDEELNSLWSRLIEKVTPEEKEELLNDQRAWIKRKEAAVKEAGNEALGGTLQPQLENGTACVYTRKRTYYLATVLAKALGEDFEIPSEVEKSYSDVDTEQ